MGRKQISTLFICSLVPWTVGNGLVPLLPLYATQLGADPTKAGNYLAFSYLAIAQGAVSVGWISDRFRKRKIPIIIAGLIGIPIAWLTGRAGSIWSLSVLTAILWFCGGVLGFTGAGYALQNFGVLPTFGISIILPLVPIIMLIPVRSE